MFHFDRGLKLTRSGLAIDFRRRQPRGFVSHAHSDHMARHELALCTPATARLYEHRYGPRPTSEMPYRQTLAWGDLKLTTYPAGHCLGSAMLLAEEDGQSLLYTGDFKLGESATAERAELPRADILVIESTFGDPRYRMTPRAEAIAQLYDLVSRALAAGRTPVVEAYVTGKGQEVSKILTLGGFPVLQHPLIHAVSTVYRKAGVDLGDCHLYPGHYLPGHVVVVPPRMHRAARLAGLRSVVSFAVSGWAMHPGSRNRLGVDHAIPLSDHADFDELLSAVAHVAPRVTYCTHGPGNFYEILRGEGFNAHPLAPRDPAKPAPLSQKRLFC